VIDLRTQVWWTAADTAELDLLAYELVKAAWRHREGCSVCSRGGPWCGPLREAVEGVIEWRQGRVLQSLAAWLREREDAAEQAAVTRGGLF
jgi:hypothetical protein